MNQDEGLSPGWSYSAPMDAWIRGDNGLVMVQPVNLQDPQPGEPAGPHFLWTAQAHPGAFPIHGYAKDRDEAIRAAEEVLSERRSP